MERFPYFRAHKRTEAAGILRRFITVKLDDVKCQIRGDLRDVFYRFIYKYSDMFLVCPDLLFPFPDLIRRYSPFACGKNKSQIIRF